MANYNQPTNHTATIAAAGTISTAISLPREKLVAIVTDANWTTSDVTLQAKFGETWVDIVATSTLTAIAADRYIPIDANDSAGAVQMRVKAGTTQSSETVVTMVGLLID